VRNEYIAARNLLVLGGNVFYVGIVDFYWLHEKPLNAEIYQTDPPFHWSPKSEFEE
jgi:hypothetical protein